MNMRHGLAGLVVAGVSMFATGAVPAFAAGPPVPAGCAFDQATGVLTCITTTTSATTAGPFTGGVIGNFTVGGFTAAQICAAAGMPDDEASYIDLTLTETVATTTTTERHGLHGKVFHTSTSTAGPSLSGVQGQLSCASSR